MTIDRSYLLTSVGISVLALASPAGAQSTSGEPAVAEVETPSQPAQPEAFSAGDIIVTARKRQESILRVPVIESVITQAQLERTQVADLSDVSSLTPGIVIGAAPLEIGTQVSIRGIGTTALDPGIDQSVSLNLDGLQLTQGSAYSVGLFDMQQVEILKGPQALFFGKNSPAGVVSIRTADPGDKFELIGRYSHEFYSAENRGELIVSGPVTDTLGIRVASLYSHTAGYFKNRAIAATQFGALQPTDRFGRTKTFYIRGTVVYKPAANLSARLKVNYTRDRVRDGAPFQLASCPDGTNPYTGIPFFAPGENCKGDRYVATVALNPSVFPGILNNGVPFTNIKQRFGSLELNYDIDPTLRLTSVTGYYKLNVGALIGGSYSGGAASFIAAQKQFSRRDFTQELRLTSDLGGPLNFTFGGFYQDGNIRNDIDLLTNGALSAPPGPGGVLLTGTQDVDIKSISGFGQLRYKVVPELELSAGVRYTDERRRDHALTSFSGYAGPYIPFDLKRISSKNWSPEVTLTYTPTPDLTVFASLKQGYKSGSYNLIIPYIPSPLFPDNDNTSFGDEKVRGGEIGLKSRLLDRQVFLNTAFYYYKYDGLQVGVNEATEGSGIPNLRTINAGSSKVYGVDFDVNYRPRGIEGLAVYGAVNWNHGRFTSFRGAPCYGGQTIAEGCNLLPVPVNVASDPYPAISFSDPAIFNGAPSRFTSQDLKGLPLTRAPDWQVNLGFSYEMPFGDGLKLTFGSDGQYTSRLLTNLGPRADFFQKKFAKLNANIALGGQEDRWNIALIARNLTNEYTTANCTNLNYAGANLPGVVSGASIRGPGGSDEVHCTFDPGREITMRLTLRM